MERKIIQIATAGVKETPMSGLAAPQICALANDGTVWELQTVSRSKEGQTGLVDMLEWKQLPKLPQPKSQA